MADRSSNLAHIPQDADALYAGRDLLEQLQPFPAYIIVVDGETGGVAAWPRQAVDEAGSNWIGNKHEYDRQRARGLEQRLRPTGAIGEDHVGRERNQLGRDLATIVGAAGGPAVHHPHVAAIDPAQFLEPVQKSGETRKRFRIVRSDRHQHPDTAHPALLRARSERPRRRRAAEKRDELPPSHSITSSARASRLGGTSRPSAFAVFRLITSSNLVGACTGRSVGFSPLRMRSTYAAAGFQGSLGLGP